VCPTSCATTVGEELAINESGSGSVLVRASSGPTCTKYQSRTQVHHVVVEPDAGLQDFAGAGIADVRAVGILDRRRQPAHEE